MGPILLKTMTIVLPCAMVPLLILLPNNFRIVTATFAATFSFFLGLFAYIKNETSPVNRYFALFNFSLGTWNIISELVILLPNSMLALVFYRISYIGGSLVVPFYMNFMFALIEESPEVKLKFKFKYANMVGLMLVFLSLTPLIIKDISYDPISLTPVQEIPGLAYPIFAVLFLVGLIYSLYPLISGLCQTSASKHNQLKYIVVAVILGAVGASIFFGSSLNPKIPPLHYVFQIGVTTTLAMAIVRHRLLDIGELSRDSIVYGGTSVLLAGGFIAAGIWFAPSYPRIVFTVTALTLTFVVPFLHRWLRRRLTPVVDQTIFRGRFDYQKSLQNIGDKAFTIYSLKELLDTVVKDVAAALGTDTCYALIREGRTDTFELWAETGLNDELHDKCVKVEEGNDFIKALVKRKKVLVKEDLMVVSAEDSNKNVVKAMEERGCAVVAPLYFNEKLNGVLALGPKNNRRMYTHKDVELLEKLSHDVSHAYGFLSIIYDQALTTARTAHDAKQPLSGACGMLKLLLEEKAYGPLPEKIHAELDYVYKRNVFVSEFFNDLMALNNMIRLRLAGKYTFEAYDMGKLLDFIVHGLKSVAESKGLELRLLCPGDLPKGYGVNSSVQRVLSNLITNSIKFTSEGFVEVAARADGEYIEVKITDTGPGMSEDHVKNLFMPFYRIEGKKSFVEGAGLGLTIVKEVLDAHKGKIKVESQLGEGTEFTVLLPCEVSI